MFATSQNPDEDYTLRANPQSVYGQNGFRRRYLGECQWIWGLKKANDSLLRSVGLDCTDLPPVHKRIFGGMEHFNVFLPRLNH